VDPHDPLAFRKSTDPSLTYDDKIWLWCMTASRFTTVHRPRESPAPGGNTLRQMLNLGIYDWPVDEKPWESSTRSMRYAACLTDRLWEMVETERLRVWGLFSLQ
jgi:hypothetical protein